MTIRYPYCISCIDQTTGKEGSFVYDPAKGDTSGNFHAITLQCFESAAVCVIALCLIILIWLR